MNASDMMSLSIDTDCLSSLEYGKENRNQQHSPLCQQINDSINDKNANNDWRCQQVLSPSNLSVRLMMMPTTNFFINVKFIIL